MSTVCECSAVAALRSVDSSTCSRRRDTRAQAVPAAPSQSPRASLRVQQQEGRLQHDAACVRDELHTSLTRAFAQCEQVMQHRFAVVSDALAHLDTRLTLHEACVARARAQHEQQRKQQQQRQQQQRVRERQRQQQEHEARATVTAASSSAVASAQVCARVTALADAVVHAVRRATADVHARLAAAQTASAVDARLVLEMHAAARYVQAHCTRCLASPAYKHDDGHDTDVVGSCGALLPPSAAPLIALAQQLRNVCTVLDNYTAEAARVARHTTRQLRRWQHCVEALVQRGCRDVVAVLSNYGRSTA